MEQRTLVGPEEFQLTINRLCLQLIENHDDFANSVIIGLQPRGAFLAKRIHQTLLSNFGINALKLGNLDVTFFRDDFRRHDNPLIPSETQIDFIIENKKVILVDDVLFTGRTIRSGLDALMNFGRPKKVELMVLIDRKYSRDLPIQADYVGKRIDSVVSQKVKVDWKETDGDDKIWLITNE